MVLLLCGKWSPGLRGVCGDRIHQRRGPGRLWLHAPLPEPRAQRFPPLAKAVAWLFAALPVICTVTAAWAHWQLRVPPLKFALPLRTPLSMDGWMEMAGMVSPLFLNA